MPDADGQTGAGLMKKDRIGHAREALIGPAHRAAQPPVRTGRLLLRRFEAEDADAVRRLADNRNVSETTLNMPWPYGPGVAERWIGRHAGNWASRSSASWAITFADTRTLTGAITLTWIHRSAAELGYWIGEPFWGRGYCSEAAGALIGFAFAELGIERIVAEHLRRNPASGRVMQKAGMQHVGSVRRRDRHRRMADMEIYEIRDTPEVETGG
jgi:RimJ/RimL family protein N-acetyltransferase